MRSIPAGPTIGIADSKFFYILPRPEMILSMLSKINKTTLGIIIAVLTAFVYGFYPSSTRVAYAEGANAVFIIFVIAILRAVIFTGFCIVTKRPLFSEQSHNKVALSNGFFQALATSAIIISMLYLPGPVAIIILFTYPMMLYLFLVFRGKEALNFITILSVALTIIGLSLVLNLQTYLEASTKTLNLIGVSAAFIAAIATTSRIYVLGNILQSRDAPTIGAESYLFCLIFSGLFLFYDLPSPPSTSIGWLCTFLSGLTSTLGGFGLFYGIQLIGSFRFSFISKLEPIFAAIIAALLINEVLSVTQYIGIAIVIASLIFYQTQRAHKQKI